MPITNTSSSYGSITKIFHWLTALLLVSAFILGLNASDTAHEIMSPDFDGAQETLSRATLLFSLHKTIGIAAFFTAVARIIWALSQPKPGLLHPENKPEALAAEVVHWLLYGAMVMTPLTGWIHHAATTGFAPIWWPFGQDLPFVEKSETVADLFGSLHWVSSKTLQFTFFLHVAGAIKHVVIDRDATLKRMLPGSRNLPIPPAQSHSLTPAVIALVAWGAVLAAGVALNQEPADHHSTPVAQNTPSGSATVQHDSDDAPQQAQGSGGNWTVESGTLNLTIVQMGSDVRGSFANWEAQIQFEDPAGPGPAGSVVVDIDIASLSLGTVTDQAMGAEYFDSSQFPTARFEADLEKLTDGYHAVGFLTLRGQRLPLTLPFSLQIDGNRAEMSGQTTINRIDYGIGLGTKEEGTLGFDVVIEVALQATSRN